MSLSVLVIGSGGREHALVWALAHSPLVGSLFCAPGNPGIGRMARCVPAAAGDREQLLDLAERLHADLTVVGPEAPLAAGLVDAFTGRGLPVFGPTRRAAELEWSKAFAKAFMNRHDIPTARHATFTRERRAEAAAHLGSCPLPVVLKADGLASGKGVVICRTREEAAAALSGMFDGTAFGAAGAAVVVEEFLEGEEASVFVVTDGTRWVTLASAQDHKRALDGDQGKNTGGMGAYAPTPFVSPGMLDRIEEEIVQPVLEGMAAEERPYRGCLYVGLMLTGDGPKVVEFNCRFGDPETQVVLPLYAGDAARLLQESARGALTDETLAFSRLQAPGAAACVVLASGGYPDAYRTGARIHGLETLEGRPGIIAFHAGTALQDGHLVTAGGRVLGITAVSSRGLPEALAAAYEAVGNISFERMYFRHDIGRRALRHTTQAH